MKKSLVCILLTFVSFSVLSNDYPETREEFLEHYKQRAKEVFGFSVEKGKELYNSDFVQGNIDNVAVMYEGAKEGVFNPEDFCQQMETNSELINDNKWFMNTGLTIQHEALNGNIDAVMLINEWKHTLRKTDPNLNVVNDNMQIESDNFQVYDYPAINEFDDYWMSFWSKESTIGFGTYRCFRDANGNETKMVDLINLTAIFMASAGETTWSDDFKAMTSKFVE